MFVESTTMQWINLKSGSIDHLVHFKRVYGLLSYFEKYILHNILNNKYLV